MPWSVRVRGRPELFGTGTIGVFGQHLGIEEHRIDHLPLLTIIWLTVVTALLPIVHLGVERTVVR